MSGFPRRSNRAAMSRIVLLSVLLCGSPLLQAESAECRPGMAGPLATLALLYKKSGVSQADFQAYWRDIHGLLATRIPGFWTYRQYHIGGTVSALTRIPEAAGPVEPLDGFADVTFCQPADIAGLAASPEADLIRADEVNVFDSTYLYGAAPGQSQTLVRSQPFAEMPWTAQSDHLILLLARAPEESVQDFRQAMSEALVLLQRQCTPQRLRVNFFQPYDADAWPAPGVNHRPRQILDASLELEFTDRKASLACLARSPVLARQQGGIAAQRLQLAYRISDRFAMVADGAITLVGVRGLPAMAVIRRLGAENQTADAVLRTVYGQRVRP